MKPPSPILLSVGLGGGGTGSSSNVIVDVDEVTNNETVRIISNETAAITIDSTQYVVIGAASISAATSRLTVSAPLGQCIQLINENVTGANVSLSVTSVGALSIESSANQIRLGTNNMYIGSSKLYINDKLVTSTADQLNYVTATPGIADSNKALVADGERNISGISTLTASSLTGTIMTGQQPNITSLDSVNITSLSLKGTPWVLTVAESLAIHEIVAGQVQASKALIVDSNKSIIGINDLRAQTLTGTLQTPDQSIITKVGTLGNLNVGGLVGVGTSAPGKSIDIVSTTPSLRMSTGTFGMEIGVDGDGNTFLSPDRNLIIGNGTNMIFNGSSSTISGLGSLTATALTGTIATAEQPNITSIGTLSSLNVSDDVAIGNLTTATQTGSRVVINEPTGACIRLERVGVSCDISVTALGDMELIPHADLLLKAGAAIRMGGALLGVTNLSALTLVGEIQTAAQPNITSIGDLTSLTVSGGMSSNSLTANSITGEIQTAAQPKITSIGVLSSLTVSGAISASSLSASTIEGTLQTHAQPNITSIGTLNELSVTGAITGASLSADSITGTLATGPQLGITSIGTLSSLSVINGVAANAVTAVNLTGTIQTGIQPNIISIGTLDALSVNGAITSDTINVNGVYGTIMDGAQTNITSVGTLDSLSVISNITTNVVTADTLTGAISTTAQPAITSVGTLIKLNTRGAIGINVPSPSYMIDIDATPATELPGIRIASSSETTTFVVGQSGLTIDTTAKKILLGTNCDLVFSSGALLGLANISATTLTGTLSTQAQPNITSVGTLSHLETTAIGVGIEHDSTFSASIYSAAGNLLKLSNGTVTLQAIVKNSKYTFVSSANEIAFDTNISLRLNGGSVLGIDVLTVNSLVGTLSTGAQPNITSVGTLSSLSVTGNISVGGSLVLGGTAFDPDVLSSLAGVTPGTVTASKAVVVDGSKNITGFNSLTATSITGTLATADQPNITSVGTLSSLSVTGGTGVGTTTPAKKVEINSTTGNCLRLTYDKVVTNKYMDITINNLGAAAIQTSGTDITIGPRVTMPQVIIGTDAYANTTLPLELGYVSYRPEGPYAYNTSGNSHAITSPSDTAYNYSLRAAGRILCTQSVDVLSDRRTKTNIKNLTDEYCSSFVRDLDPVSFNWIHGDDHRAFGYIAQDLVRAGFHDLVNLVPDPGVKKEVDADGLISPEGVKFTVTYQHIIPILAKNQKRLMQENEDLKAKLDAILALLQERAN